MTLRFEKISTRLPERFYERVALTPVSAPRWLAVNLTLARELGLDENELRSPETLSALAGNAVPEGAEPVALAYAGHQFGNFVPRLGDGRAMLLGALIARDGSRYDVQLKGSGPTSFSRGGDGRAAIGPVLREFLVSEAMHTLGIPTTRSLAAVATGETVYRDRPLPGAVLTRVASSHLRVGTFEYFAARRDREALATLVEYALARHYPDRVGGPEPAMALLHAVIGAQSSLVAKWLSVGFVHGVMNTDNCAISGETIDYGPCAFLDAYDPARRFSSIDHGGRYAFSNQPRIALWNVTRLAEALLPVIDDDEPRAIALAEGALATFAELFERAYIDAMRAKVGLFDARDDDDNALVKDLLAQMAESRADFTRTFTRLTRLADGGDDELGPSLRDGSRWSSWRERWERRAAGEGTTREQRVARMRAANPVVIARNHRVEEALEAAEDGDLAPFERLRAALAQPFETRSEYADLAEAPGESQWSYRTFCGT